MAKFIGFSTVSRTKPPYSLTDIDLVKQDLLNAFNTRRGERAMLPNFGSRVWDILMDPYDSVTENIIKEDVSNIINQDPRVQLVSTSVTDEGHAVRVDITLKIFPLVTPENLVVLFDRQNTDSL